MIRVTLELFGALRELTDQGSMELLLTPGSGLEELRLELQRALEKLQPGVPARGLIESSAFADETSILDRQARFERDLQLAVLPPVCGG